MQLGIDLFVLFGGSRKAYPLLNLTRMIGVPEEEGVAVAGPCCTPLDTFGNNIPLVAPEAGDLIGVFYSGAYGFSASNLDNFAAASGEKPRSENDPRFQEPGVVR